MTRLQGLKPARDKLVIGEILQGLCRPGSKTMLPTAMQQIFETEHLL